MIEINPKILTASGIRRTPQDDGFCLYVIANPGDAPGCGNLDIYNTVGRCFESGSCRMKNPTIQSRSNPEGI